MRTHADRKLARAFTLIELLAAIAIIAILAALLLAGISSVRKSANAAKSLSNLRTLAVVAMTFSLDNDGRIPGAATLFPKNFGNNPQHAGELELYGVAEVRVDPAAPELALGYGLNLELSPRITPEPVRDQSSTNWGGSESPRFWTRSCYTWLDIEQPSATILYCVTPAQPGRLVAWYFGDPWSMSNANSGPDLPKADRHRKGQVQAVMADGHTKMIDLNLLVTNPKDSLWLLKK
jgi:prepilin-type N-terminal cleavage/methylation domain-containing protein